MKIIILLSLALIVSCGSDHGNAPLQNAPSALQGGTWIAQDANNVTTEIVFNPGAAQVTTVTNGTPVLKTYTTSPWQPPLFLVNDNNGYWSYEFIDSNRANICMGNAAVRGSAWTCQTYTR